MLARRRMTFQLTPLLDLLLIVIFAQFMDVDQQSQEDAATRDEAVSQAESEAEQQLLKASAAEESACDADPAREEMQADLETERKRFQEELERMELQQQEVGELVSRLFRVPEKTVDEAIKAIESAAKTAPLQNPISDERLEKIRSSFDQIAKTRGREAVQHVLAFDEMTRHLEIWELDVNRLGQVVFKANGKEFEFRFRDAEGVNSQQAETNFNNRVFNAYKSLTPHGKSIVLILVRFDRKISFFYLRPMMRVLPKLVERLQQDSFGKTRYEFAVLGGLGFSSSSK